MLNAEYFKRIDALNYTMLHDDGQHIDDLEEADVVLVGVSRTSKTPTSIYLANRGVKTANIPLVPGMPVAAAARELHEPLVVGLFASPERIVQIRQNRLLGLKAHHDDDQYIDRKAVAEEVSLSRQLCAKHNWPIIDVTRRSIEETAAAMMELWPSAAGSRWHDMPLWLAARPLVLASKSAIRAHDAGGGRHSGRDRSRRYRRARIESERRRHRIPARSRRCWRGRRRVRSPRACRAASCSAPTRRWRWASGGSPSRPTGRRRASSCASLRGKTHELHSAVALVRDGAVRVRALSRPRG